MKVALVHDWLTGMRGGEKVLEALCELFPDAPIFTLVHVPGSVSELIESRAIHTSFIQRLPGSERRYRAYLPLFPAAIESFDLRGYDLVVSSSHAVAKGVLPDPQAVHIAYLHTPMRYVWDLAPEYTRRLGPAGRIAHGLMAPWLRAWDAAAAVRVDRFVANSRHVARRIARFYGREAEVVHPPVDVESFTPGPVEAREHLLVVSALVPYKDIELAIRAVAGTRHRLIVAGDGPGRASLAAMAGPEVRFLGRVSGAQLLELYRGALALLMPGEEDFGIAAVEAQACGCPVVAYARGGCLETVRDGETGVFFAERDVAALRQAIDTALRIPFNRQTVRDNALRFSKSSFLKNFRRVLEPALESQARSRR